MKKVLIEMEKLKNLHSGLGQYCFQLGKALSSTDTPGLALSFYVPEENLSTFGEKPDYLRTRKYHRLLRVRKPFDVWHCTHQESSYLPSGRNTKIILTIHDLNFLHTGKSPLKVRYRLSRIQRLIDKASALTTISAYTASEIRQHLDTGNLPLHVIHNGNNMDMKLQERKPSFVPEKKFFFSIGILSEKKNFHKLLPLLRHFSDHILIIAGDNSTKYARELAESARTLQVEDRVFLPGSVSEEEKRWLYNHCSAFLFPSRAEGFGLPVIEAMSQGKPVFLSRYTSLPEVGGDKAFYFNSMEAEDMAETIRAGLKQWELNKMLADEFKEWAAKFSWQAAAKKYIDLYLHV